MRTAALLPLLGGTTLLLLGALTLAGWLFEVGDLVRLAGYAAAKANAATCFLGLGLALITKRAAGAYIAAAIAGLTLVEHLGVNLGIDQLLAVDALDANHNAPGRMAASTAFALLALGLGIAAPSRWGHAAVAVLVVGLAVGVIATLGYLFRASTLYQLGAGSMAPQTAVLVVVGAIGALARRTNDNDFLRLLVSTSVVGATARSLLPVLALGPVLLTVGRLALQDAGYIDTRFGVALLTTGNLFLATGAVVWSTRSAVAVEMKNLASEVEVERARQASQVEARFHAVLDASPFAVLAHRGGKIVLVNRKLIELYGYSEAQLTGMPAVQLIHPDDRPRAIARLVAAAKGEAAPPLGTIRAQRADGSVIHIDSDSASMLLDGLPTTVGSAIDVSARVAATARLTTALAEKELLLTEVHHRVKNNLQIVTSLISLARGQIDDVAAGLLFEQTGSRVRAMALLHERLYRTGEFGRVDMGAYLTSIVDELRRADPRSNDVNLVVDGAGLFLSLDDAIPCGLVVNELVTNAFKHAFAKKGGTLSIRLAVNGASLALSVEDDGAGLPAGFDPDRARGLGLPLVGGLARQLGGAFQFNGAPPGARFTVTFPQNRCAS